MSFVNIEKPAAGAEGPRMDAWGEKSMYGRKYMGILRSTFIIDNSGRISAVFPKVKPKGHAREILEALRS